jgi:sporulation protein YtfJ
MEKLRTVVDSDTIIGKPIEVGDITIIPVSKVSFGLASGGSEFPSKNSNAKMFGGGGGAGASVTPVCFLVVKGNEVKVLNTTESTSPIEKAIDAVPHVIDKVTSLFKKNDNDNSDDFVD